MITTEATFTLDVAGTSSQPLVLTTGSNIISLLEGSGRGTLVASFSVPDNKILDAVSIVGSPLAAPFYISGNGLYYRGDPRSYMNDDPFATVTLEFDVSDEDTGRLEPLYEHTISVRTIPALEVEITDNTGTIVGEGGHIDIAEAGDTVIENPNQPRTSLIVAGTTEAVRLGTITVKNSSSFTNIVVDFADTNHEYFENGVHKYIEIRSTATGADFFLKAGQQLDYETLEDLQKLMFGINAKVTAQTSTGYTLSHVTPVNFEVTNANDYTTAKTEYALNVDEDAEVGSLLAGTIELSDVDSIKPVRVRMEFVGEGEDVSTHGSLFGFQQQDSSNPLVWNLVLLSGMDLDHEATATYNTTILAKILRNGYEGREQKLYFNVDITVNDAGIEAVAMPPNSDVQTPFIHASASIGDSAGSIRGTFGDRTVTYDLTADHYAIDSNTGEITLKSPFDGTDLIPTESDGRIFHTINVQMFANRGTTTETTTEPFTIEVNATTAVSIIALEKDGSDYKADNSDLSADRDGDTLSFKETTAITTREGNTVTGSYTVSGSGELVWTPDATFSGTALFGVTIKDSRGGEGTANVTAYVAPIVEVEITDNTGTIVGEGGHIDIAEAGDTVVENSSQPRTSLIVAGTTEAVRLGTITVKNSSSFTNIGVDFADTNHEYFENGVHKYIEIISTATGGELRLKAGQQLDYEALEDLQKLMFGINVKVRADISHDGGTTTNTVYSKVTPVNFEVTNANDYTTAKTQYALNVDEDAEVGSLVAGTIELSDVDSIKPSRIRMEFVGEGEDVITHGSLFGFQQQDSNNPLVWNLVLLSGMDLDHEDEEIYNTTILAKVLRNGYEGREQKLYFNVDITVNDAGIKSVAVPPNSDVQTLFIHASASIGDSAGSISGTFGDRTVTYDLTADHYRIDPNTGEITFKTAFDEADLEPTESDGRIFHTINVQMFANRGTTTETTTEPFKIEVNATTLSTIITLDKDGSDYKADNSDLSADRDGDTLSFKETTAITTRDGNTVTGSYTVSRSGELEWTPDATFSGIATFGVTIKDSRGGEGTANITVDVPPQAVIDLAPILKQTVQIGAELGSTIVGVSATVPDGSPITYSLTNEDGTQSEYYQIGATSGAITLKTALTGLESATDTWPYTRSTTHKVKVTASANNTAEASQIVTIDVNDMISVPKIVLQKSANSDTYSVRSQDLFPDFDGDTLTIESVEGTITTDHGSYTISNGNLVWTSDTNFSGTEIFTVTVTDGNGGEREARVTAGIEDPIEFRGTLATSEDIPDIDLLQHQYSWEVTAYNARGNVFDWVTRNHNLTLIINNITIDEWNTEFELNYGTLTVTKIGRWEYTLDKDHPDVQALDGDNDDTDGAKGSLTEEMTVTVNGSTVAAHDFVITINGRTDFSLGDQAGDGITAGPAPTFLHPERYEISAQGEGEHYTINVGTSTYDDLVITTNSGSDIIHGSDRGETINAGSGRDLLFGYGGNDTIFGGSDYDRLYGGDGNDMIYSGGGGDTIYGGDGNDTIRSGGAWKMIHGEDGNDTIYSNSGGGSIYGGDGHDVIHGGSSQELINAGDGNDTIYGNGGRDYISGGDGDDTLSGGGHIDRLQGDAGVDTLIGGSSGDIFVSYSLSRDEWKPTAGNHKIVTDFSRYGDRLQFNTENGNETSLQAKKDAAGIRWVLESVDTGTATNNPNILDTVVYYTNETSTFADDFMVMVLEDYTQDLTNSQIIVY